MVASYLTRSRITSYVLDPEGDDDLWSGANRDLDDFLATTPPPEETWRARPASPVPDDTPAETSGTSSADDSAQEPAPHSGQQIFDIPERRRGWFTQILTRAAAATTLLFAGDSATARDYATQRQRGEIVPAHPGLFDADPPWAQGTTRSLRLRNGMRLEGTRFLTPLPDGQNLEIFRGVDQHLYRLLAENKVGPYIRAAPRTYERWSHAPRLDDAAVSVARDGTALVIRLTSGR